MAPDIMRGLCPHPCDHCKKKQIQKIMGVMSQKYPQEWNQLVQKFSGWKLLNLIWYLNGDIFYI